MITFLTIVMVCASIGAVAWPLLKGMNGRNEMVVEDSQVSELLAQKDATLFAISELESDYNMGNLSPGDYQELRQKYEDKAMALIKTMDGLRSERGLDIIQASEEIETPDAAGETVAEDIEAKVLKLRTRGRRTAAGKSCSVCGAPVSAGDVFCSRCGAALSATCPGCSVAVEPGDRFCARCGTALNNGKKGRRAA